jgi:hypothetical protein
MLTQLLKMGETIISAETTSFGMEWAEELRGNKCMIDYAEK